MQRLLLLRKDKILMKYDNSSNYLKRTHNYYTFTFLLPQFRWLGCGHPLLCFSANNPYYGDNFNTVPLPETATKLTFLRVVNKHG